MPTRRIPLRRRPVRGDFSGDAEMELLLGPDGDRSIFADRDELEAAWAQNGARLMSEYARHGRRPLAWWQFEAPGLGLVWPGRDRERSTLYANDLLGPEEREQLVAWWRSEFTRAEGFAAGERWAHHAWCDLPASLVERWTAEQKGAALPAGEPVDAV